MKRTLALVLALVLVITCASFPTFALEIGTYSQGSQSLVQAVEFTTSNAKVVGRNNPANPFVFAWHMSGVEFDVTGTEIAGIRISSYDAGTHWAKFLHVTINGQDVTLNGKLTTETYDYGEYNAAWLAANPQPEANAFTTKKGTTDYILATDLDPNQTYTVRVVLNNENWGQYWQSAVRMTHALVGKESTAKVSRTADSNRRIIFYGDSITSAGALGGVHNSYHQITARTFGADSQVISASGGIFVDYSTYAPNELPVSEVWNLCSWNKKARSFVNEDTDGNDQIDSVETAQTWEIADADKDGVRDPYETDPDNLNFPADLIVVNIGTNDEGSLWSDETKAVCQEEFRSAFNQFVDEVRYYYPNATIVLSYGLMRFIPAMQPFYEGLVSDYIASHSDMGKNAAGNAKLTTFFYTKSATLLNDNHPDKYGHQKGAEELINFLKGHMGWETVGDMHAYPDNNGVMKNFPKTEYGVNSLPLGFEKLSGGYLKLNDTLSRKVAVEDKYVNLSNGAMDGVVDSDSNPNDPHPFSSSAKYENGFYLQGAQIRTQVNPADANYGLRFIVVNNTDIKAKLEQAITQNLNFERGMLVVSGSKFDGKNELVIGTQYSQKVVAQNIFTDSQTLKANYDKYTVCVTNIPEQHFETRVYVRPYFKYTDLSGVEHTYYGEQYSSTLFDMALVASENEKDEATIKWLNDTILSKCTGDNDLRVDF